MPAAIPVNFDFPGETAAASGNGTVFVPVVGQVAAALPHRLTVDQVEAALRSGVLTENDHCELIRGELIEKMTIGDAHTAAVRRLVRFFKRLDDESALLGVQDAIKLKDSRPEPDVTLLRPTSDCYESQTATPADIFLLIEVADNSLEFDRVVKRPLYAENGIQEYWIVNLIGDCIEVYRQTQANGTYADERIVRRGESIAPLAMPDLILPVDQVLGNRPSSS
jgi:Uma2 family endonuclease